MWLPDHMQPVTTTQWEQSWLPLWPLASDDLLHGVYRTTRKQALGVRYIEANPHALSNLLVVDIDHGDSMLRAIDRRAGWLPNAVVENPHNGHAHAVWALREPVTRTQYARRKPLALAAAVTEGLRRSVDGDQAYSGLMTKNPTHEAWNGAWFTNHLYTLPELTTHLEKAGYMPPAGWRRTRRKNPIGLGRNCTIFETARTWAYPRIRDYHDRSTTSAHHFAGVINTHVQELNNEFTEPLPASEAHAIATSIHKWITTRSNMWLDGAAVYNATFTLIQANRGRKSGEARRGEKFSQVQQLALEGGTQA